MADEVEEKYLKELITLKINSKPLINSLTMMAEDFIQSAPKVVQVVEKHLARVKPEGKLPILYLIDSIVKNIKKDYLDLFSQNIVSTFCSVFERVDDRNVRAHLFKLRQTWVDVFPAKKLIAIDMRCNDVDEKWPIGVGMSNPGTTIHLNPKFLSHGQPYPAGLAFPPTLIAPDYDVSISSSEPVTESQMREQLLIKQKQLLELQAKKLELELLQTQAKLDEQSRKKVQEEQTNAKLCAQAEIAKQKTQAATSIIAKANAVVPVELPPVPKKRSGDEKEDRKGRGGNDERTGDAKQDRKSRGKDDKSRKNDRGRGREDFSRSKKSSAKTKSNRKRTEIESEDAEGKEKKSPSSKTNDVGRKDEKSRKIDREREREDYFSRTKMVLARNYRKRSGIESEEDEGKEKKPTLATTNDVDLRKSASEKSSSELSDGNSEPPSSKKSRTSTLIDNLFGLQDVDYRKPSSSWSQVKKPNGDTAGSPRSKVGHGSDDASTAEEFKNGSGDGENQPPPTLSPPSSLGFTEDKLRGPPAFPRLDDPEKSVLSMPTQEMEPKRRGPAQNLPNPWSSNVNQVWSVPPIPVVPVPVPVPVPGFTVLPILRPEEPVWARGAPLGIPRGPNPFVEAIQSVNDTLIPPVNQRELSFLETDVDATIPLDKIQRQVRFYGPTGIVFVGKLNDEPREISFQPEKEPRDLFINREPIKIRWGITRKFYYGNKTHTIRIGAPTRELYIDGQGYEVFFGGAPTRVMVDNQWVTFRLAGPPPNVEIGETCRYDLVAGRITLFVEGNPYYLYLDEKPQILDFGGFPVIAKFCDEFRSISFNGRQIPIMFGGPPKPVTIPGGRHLYIRFSPISQITQHNIMTYIQVQAQQGFGKLCPQPNTIGFGSSSDANQETEDNTSIILPPPLPLPAPPVESLDVDFTDLKKRRQNIIEALYGGTQCTSCGIRFPDDQNQRYAQHLDWHFWNNRREKLGKAPKRTWYSAAVLFEPQEDKVDEEITNVSASPIHNPSSSTVLATGYEGSTCPHCEEVFKLFWDDAKEEWRLSDAVEDTEQKPHKLYHPICHQDYLKSLTETEETLAPAALDDEDEVEIVHEGPKPIVTIEVDIGEDDRKSESEAVESPPTDVLPLVFSNPSKSPSSYRVLSPIVIDVMEESLDSNIPGIGSVLSYNQSQPQVATTPNESNIIYEPMKFDFPKIKEEPIEWKEITEEEMISSTLLSTSASEPMDIDLTGEEDVETLPSVPMPVAAETKENSQFNSIGSLQTLTQDIDLTGEDDVEPLQNVPMPVVAEIDGNLQFNSTDSIPAAPGKIKINILGLDTSSQSPKHSIALSPETQIPKSPPPPYLDILLQSEEIRRLKPRLVGRKLINNPTKRTGKEESGLCSIM